MNRLDSPTPRDAFAASVIFHVVTPGDTVSARRLIDRDAALGFQVRSALAARRQRRNAERFAKVNASTARPKSNVSLASSAR